MVDITPIGEMRQCTDGGSGRRFRPMTTYAKLYMSQKNFTHDFVSNILIHAESNDLLLKY